MLRRKTAILTITRYTSTEELRLHLACQMIGNAVALGYDFLIIDSSPDKLVRHFLSRAGAVVYRQTSQPGMGNQKRELFRIASWSVGMMESDCRFTGPEFFLWSEPEKPDLIRSIPKIIAPLESGEADIVIPERSKESLETYPEFQIESEMRMNLSYYEATGLRADPTFSPVAFTRNILPLFANCDPPAQYGDGAHDNYIQLYAPLAALSGGHIVKTVKVDCFYPLAQRREESSQLLEAMVEKRRIQADTITSTWRRMAEVLGLPQSQALRS